MTLSANQPYFFPYFPYWQLIAAADTFLVSDDYAFMKGSWIPRNRILVNGQEQFFRIEIRHQSCHRLINETFLAPMDVRGKLRTLEMAYHKAPFFADGYALASRILACPERRLDLFLGNAIREVCAYLGIGTRLLYSAGLSGGHLPKTERVFHYCHRLGAERYVNAIGGQKLYNKEEFAAAGIDLRFLSSEAPFSDLSVLHLIMHHSAGELHEGLGKYHLL